jgi:hypothetical protein
MEVEVERQLGVREPSDDSRAKRQPGLQDESKITKEKGYHVA